MAEFGWLYSDKTDDTIIVKLSQIAKTLNELNNTLNKINDTLDKLTPKWDM